MMDSWVWLFCLIITHCVAYYMGRSDGQEKTGPSDEAWVEVQKYEIDKKYAFAGWLEERSGKHE